MNVIHLFLDSKSELLLDGRSAPVFNSVTIPLVETDKLKQHTNQVPGPNDLVVMMAEETTLHNVSHTLPHYEYISALTASYRILGSGVN